MGTISHGRSWGGGRVGQLSPWRIDFFQKKVIFWKKFPFLDKKWDFAPLIFFLHFASSKISPRYAPIISRSTHLSSADEASGDHFRNNIHQRFCFVYHGIDFGKGGSLAHGRIFNSELQPLNVGRHLIQLFEQFFLLRSCGNLKWRIWRGL